MPPIVTKPTAAQVRRALQGLASPARAAGVAAFFKVGAGEYGEGDRFSGVTVPDQRRVARQFRAIAIDEADALLMSPIHEERLTALLILVDQFNSTADLSIRKRIFQRYMRRLKFVNNWDLVDSSAEHIVGGWLFDKPREALLSKLARSKHLWSRRVAMLATFHFIKHGESNDAFQVARILLSDSHDLIHKAVGWMLREVGKRVSLEDLRGFLQANAANMSRTTLRYAIERLSPDERARWLAVKAAKR